LAKIDALQRARTHLAKEKANLEGERNALNKVVKEAQRSADQCLKDLKKKRGGH
jgi:predicted P-loop ATPase/GTPase